MKSRIGFYSLIAFLLVSCTNNAASSTPGIATAPSQGFPASTLIFISTQSITGTDCANEKVHEIGQSIADSFLFTTQQEVMTWFCEGAEFEDILVALETEEQTGTAAEDLLVMRAEGVTWEEIWQIVGFIE